MPEEADLTKFYHQGYTSKRDQVNKQEDNTIYYQEHVEELVKISNAPRKRLTISDIGCSYPVFAMQAAVAGVRLSIGVDWSREACDYGLERGVTVLTPHEFTSEVPNGTIDILRCSHTLEHLVDPVTVLSAHVQKLAADGLLYVTQPSIPVLHFGHSPAPPHDAVWPTHLHFFSPLSLLVLMRRLDLQVERLFTVTEENAALERYKNAIDISYAREKLIDVAKKGEKGRGANNNYPFFMGQNSGLFARKRSLHGAKGRLTETEELDRTNLVRTINLRRLKRMAETSSAPATEPVAKTDSAMLAQQRLEDLAFDTLALAVRAQSHLRSPCLTLQTDHPIAIHSSDHVHPRGTANDDTRHAPFVTACETQFNRPIRFLDLGCGGGGLVWDFVLAGHHGYGIEGSDYSRRWMRAYWRVLPGNLFTADITKPFLLTAKNGERQIFDVISAWEVLEHLPEDRLVQFFKNVREHLAPEGIFVASVATFPDEDPATGAKWHITIKPREWWLEIARENGLVIRSESYPFLISEFARGSGNPRAFDWDVRVNSDLGFHLVLGRTDAAHADLSRIPFPRRVLRKISRWAASLDRRLG